MSINLYRTVRRSINFLLNPVDLEIVRKHSWDNPRTYIPFKDTLTKAKQLNLSVGEFIDATYQEPGVTQETIDQMKLCGVFDKKIENVCEIGPGSGRYLEKTLQACNPESYEIYETSYDWARWVVQNYHVKLQATDGISLAGTPDHSIDLIQAHRVFSYVPFFTTVSYYLEMIRVIREGGYIVFDITTEDCMKPEILGKWLTAGFHNSAYPTFMSKRLTLDIFQEHGFTLAGNFCTINKPGLTEYFIFTKS
jgi:hypothetical protein